MLSQWIVDDSDGAVCEEVMQTGMAWGFIDRWPVRLRCRRRRVPRGGEVRGRLTK
jgi:hypothetical protein